MEKPQRLTQPLSLRAKDAAAALGVSERKFRAIQNQLPHVNLGGIRVFPVDALRAWLTANARTRESEIDQAVEEALRATRRPQVEKPMRRVTASRRGTPANEESEAG